MSRLFPLAVVVFAALMASAAVAQQPPHAGYVFPAGGQQGRSVTVRVGGQFLDGASEVHVSGKGVSAKVIEHTKPISQKEANALREKLKTLMAKKTGAPIPAGKGKKPVKSAAGRPAKGPAATALTAQDWRMIAEIRKKLARFARRPANPSIAETVTLEVALSPDAEPGHRELRLQTSQGLTNPLIFQVGNLPEIVHKRSEAEDEPGPVPAKSLKPVGPVATGPQPIADIPLPAVVNGQIMSGQVDRFRFQAKRGQQIIVVVAAQKLIPYLADAVPGWFQAVIAIRDEQGRELAYSGGYRFHPDPALHFEVPRDGSYLLEIHDSIFRGRDDFVYRLAVGELPFVTRAFPLGARVGGAADVSIQGWNLASGSLSVDGRDRLVGRSLLDFDRGPGPLNAVPFAWDNLPEVVEQGHGDGEQGQRVKLPMIVNGCIRRAGERDVFRFEGRAGQAIVAEVHARRLDSPLDSVLKLTDAAGRQLAVNDDHEDQGCGLITHHADSWLRAVLPATGTYDLQLSDAQNQGGDDYAYRLRIGPPQPDFELRVVPSSLNLRAGGTATATVHVLRRDGFDGPIDLALEDAPDGFQLGGGRVPAGQSLVRVTITAPVEPPAGPAILRMEGRALVAGNELRRRAVPADDMMQAFFYHHLVPVGDWMASVTGRGRGGLGIHVRQTGPLRLPSGGTAELHLAGPRGPAAKAIQFGLSDPPEGLSVVKTAPSGDGYVVTLRADAAKLKPGWKGNIIMEAYVERVVDNKTGKKPAKRRQSLGILPAVGLEVVAIMKRQ